jgi:transmembrane sensor
MHHGDAMNIPEKTALQAAEWFFRPQDPAVTQHDQLACNSWRNADQLHEAAWQRAVEVSHRMRGLPGGLAYATLAHSQQAGRRRAIKNLAVLLATGIGGSVAWQGWESEAARVWRAEYSTRTGEQQQIQLADGTAIHLNTATGVNTVFNPAQRLIVLEAGEIMVQTGHQDPLQRPLLVATRFGLLRPLGTRFSVRQTAEHIRLTVLEGAVEITTGYGQQRVLEAGWQTHFNRDAIDAPTVASRNQDSWTRGVLHVREMPLAEFASELARYRNGYIRCAPEVAELKISGAFQLANTDDLLASLPGIAPVSVRYRTRYWVMLDKPDTE